MRCLRPVRRSQLRQPDSPEDFDLDAALKQAGPVVTKLGDLIVLGTDSRTQHQQVKRLMNGRASLFATDPPYLVDYNRHKAGGTRRLANRPARV